MGGYGRETVKTRLCPPPGQSPTVSRVGGLVKLYGWVLFVTRVPPKGWIAIYYASMMSEPESIATTPLGPGDTRLPISRGQERNFIECVKTRQTPASNIDDAVRSDIMSHICQIAVRRGRKIAWDPVKEEIIGDTEASRMLSRPMRDGWWMF